MRTYEYINANLAILGLALAGNLVSGIVGFVVGRVTANRGPTKTVETYTPKHEGDIPGWEEAPR